MLESKLGGYLGVLDCVLKAEPATSFSDLKVTGDAGAKILMHKEKYAGYELWPEPPNQHLQGHIYAAQWRMALSFKNCSNITVSGLTLKNAGGDGIILNDVASNGKWIGNCSKVTITNVVTDGCARNGLSVISVAGDGSAVSGLKVTNCTFKNSHGQGNVAPGGPWAGIDLEPNSNDEKLQDILIDNCIFQNNGGAGIQQNTPVLNGSTGILNITVKNCTMQGNGWYGIQVSYAPASLDDSSSIVFQDCTISDSQHAGIMINNKARDAGKLSFTNCSLKIKAGTV